MKFLFDWKLNLAMLKRYPVGQVQARELVKVLESIQSENKNEIEVTVIFFPGHLEVKVDSDELLVCWNWESSVYMITRAEDAIYVLDKKTRFISVMSIQEFEQKYERGKK